MLEALRQLLKRHGTLNKAMINKADGDNRDRATRAAAGIPIRCARRFGARPRGVWPAEGAVSDAVLRVLGGAGTAWAATGEGVGESQSWYMLTAHMKTKHSPMIAPASITTMANG